MEPLQSSGMQHVGGCDCGAVRYRVDGPLRPVVNCHCGQCRRTHGHHAAYTNAAREHFQLTTQDGLRWYRSSDFARRGFCGECGASLFWARDGAATISISAGTLDGPTGLRTAAHIYVAEAGDYYEINDTVARYPGAMP